jgi:hypothetical protein
MRRQLKSISDAAASYEAVGTADFAGRDIMAAAADFGAAGFSEDRFSP